MTPARWLPGPALALGLAAASAQAQQAPPTLGVRATAIAEAVEAALRQSPDALSSEAEVAGAEASRAEVRGGFGPKVHVDANLQQWNSPFELSFGGGAIRVREPFTWTASVSIIQPLTPLLVIYDQYKVVDLGVDVAAVRREATRKEIALRVVQAYYRLLEAQRLTEIARASVGQLEAQEKQAQSLFANGVIGKNDLLRAQLALASARQREIQTRGQVEIARGVLQATIGRPPGEPFEPVPFSGDPPPLGEPSVALAESRAVAQRVELRELDRRVDQADKSVSYAQKKLLPQVNAVGNYTHVEGSAFQQADAAYVGVFASWDVWDWGTTTSGIAQADAKLQQARVARRKLEDEVRLEARQAFVNAASAAEALAVARTAVTQAEENYRIVTKKFEANAATSFDVVDAEALLTQARGQTETALYDYLIARAALDRATGAPMPGER
jgi:outer membrane protein TolC